jgi:hypothetical protein
MSPLRVTRAHCAGSLGAPVASVSKEGDGDDLNEREARRSWARTSPPTNPSPREAGRGRKVRGPDDRDEREAQRP